VSDRETYKHAAIYSGAQLLAKAVGFIMLPFYAHILEAGGYGVIGILDMGMGFLLSLFAFGYSSGLTRFFHEEKDKRPETAISTGIILIWIFNIIILVLCLPFSKQISGFLIGESSHTSVTIMAILAFAFDLSAQAAGSYLVIKRKSVLFSSISLMKLIVGLSLNIYLIVIKGMGLQGYFISALAVAILASLITNFIVIKQCGTKFSKRIAGNIIRFQLPLVPGNLVSFISRQMERVLLRFLVDIQSVGILEMAGKFPSLIPLLITQPFMKSWNTKRVEIAEEPDAPQEIGRMFTRFLLLIVFAGLVMATVIKEVILLLTPVEFAPAIRIARIEIVSLILAGCYMHMMFGLYYYKKTKTISLIRSVTAVLKIGLSWFFISRWGINGAAYAAVVGWTIMLVWNGTLSHALYPIKLEYKRIALIVLSAVAVQFVITIINIENFGIYQWLDQSLVPALANNSFLAGLKDGKVTITLAEKSGMIAAFSVKLLMVMSYLFLFPVLHDKTRNRIIASYKSLTRGD
jgi:O-antigen/teichoic acid export membrane protein